MENGKFVDGYSEPTNYYRYSSESSEAKELMEGPRKWAAFFDRQLVLNLKQAPGEPPQQIYKQLNSYQHEWADRYLDDTIKESREIAYYDIAAERNVMELNSHLLNRELIQLWRRLLIPEIQAPLSADQLEVIQIKLAVQATRLVVARKEFIDRAGIDGVYSALPGIINGQLTEIDAALPMLEILKDDSFEDNPHLLFVSAPPQFESVRNNKQLSADYIFMDTELQASRGVQVKTSIDYFSSENTRIYDNQYVTLIDGIVDLGNSKATKGRGNPFDSIPNPGLMSLDFLKFHLSIEKAGRTPALREDIGVLIRAKETARKLSDSKTSFLLQAKKNIQGRIINDLYKN
jgi:hypothetical protein